MPTRRHELAMDAPAGFDKISRTASAALRRILGRGFDGMFDNGAECVTESRSVE